MRQLPNASIFSRSELRACGWTDPAITRAVRSGRLAVARRGQFSAPAADGTDLDPRVAAHAAARACRGSVVSHRSAALLWGLPLIGRPPRLPEVTVPPRGTGDLAAAHLYRASLRPVDVVEIDGVPVTSVARTLVDLGRHRPASTAVAAIDHALREGTTSTDDLTDVLHACSNWPRIARAVRAVAAADGRAESPLESASRLTLAWLGIPAPALQSRIRDEYGIVVARTDFYWDSSGVVGEADGRGKYDGRAVLVAEKDRQERLEELGLVVVRWGWDEVTRWPALLRHRLDRAFVRGSVRDRSGFPRLWSVDAW